MRKWFIIGFVVTVALGACVWAALRARQALKIPLATVQSFSDAIARDDFDGAYALTASEFKVSTSRESFGDMEARLIAQFGKPVRFEAGNMEIESNQYGTHETAKGVWTFQNGKPIFKFDLKYEDGRWLIFSFRQR